MSRRKFRNRSLEVEVFRDLEGTLLPQDTDIGESLLTVRTGKKFHDLTFTPDGTALIAAVGTPGDGRDWGLWAWRAPAVSE